MLSPALASGASGGNLPDDDPIDEIVVAETRLDNEQFDIGEPLGLGPEDLADIRAAEPEQLLGRLPGFAVSRPGGSGGVSELFLRGAESNFVAVYVDGARLNNPTNTRGGSYDFSTVTTYDIGRIDVVNGAMSAVYGADAMAGVILLESAWPRAGSKNASIEVGSAGDWRLGASTTFDLGDRAQTGLRASIVEGGDEIDGSSLRVETWAMRLTGAPSGTSPWNIGLRHVKRERSSFPEASGGPELAANRDVERGSGDELSISGRGSWTPSDRWQTEVHMSASRLRDAISVPAVAPGILDGQPAFSIDAEYRRTQFLWTNRVSLSSDIQIVAGLDAVDETGSDQGAVDLGFAEVPNSYELNRSAVSAFAEIGRQWRPGLTTALAARWDQSDGHGRLSGKFSVTREFSPSGNRIWAKLASGFKLPSFFALGNPLFGNSELRPETVRSAEIGWTYANFKRGQLSVAAFSSRYEDLVDFDFESFRNVNRGRIEINGIELQSTIELSPAIRLRVDLTALDVASEAGALRNRPETTGRLGLEWSPASAWHVDISARYTGARLITSIPTGDVRDDGFTLLGVTVRHTRRRGDLWMAVDNALDTCFEDAPGFPSPGARLRLGGSLIF